MLDIKRIRKERGYSQEQLADLLGISQPALSYYEKGINEPSIDMLVKMSHVLDCSIDEICCNNIKTVNNKEANEALNTLYKFINIK